MKIPFESGGVRVTGLYGKRGGEMHKGLDLVGTSSTRIVAVEDATVAVSSIVTDRENRTWQWGNDVRLDLADGRRLYHCHLAKRLVSAGEKVKKGQVIGIMGATGNANGAHLHWEIRPAGFSTASEDVSVYSGIPNQLGTYSVGESAPAAPAVPAAPAASASGYKVGDRVTIRSGAVYTNGVKVPAGYIGKTYTVGQAGTNKVLIEELYSWVETRWIEEAKTSSAPDGQISVGDRVTLVSGAVYTNGVKVPSRYIGTAFTVSQSLPGRYLIRELNSWVADKYVKKA